MPTLLVMRHAKSDWDADYGPDHDRPLNRRGVEAARRIGVVLATDHLVPDLVVTSTAIRARTTAELAAEAGDWSCDIVEDGRLYGGGTDTAITVAAEAGDVSRLMLVGHQPTWSMLVRRLTGQAVDMKTAAVAIIDVPTDTWAELSKAECSLARLIVPRDHQ